VPARQIGRIEVEPLHLRHNTMHGAVADRGQLRRLAAQRSRKAERDSGGNSAC
jgi:hypothetical protein